jgi:glycosyltransferase involved in cell wall biosynthesis
MRIGFYDPYLEILGGGEKYLLTILEEAVRQGTHDVLLLSPERPDVEAWRRLNISVAPGSFRWRRAGQLAVSAHTVGLDLFVALHNFLPPVSAARRSVAIVQFPSRTVSAARPPLGAGPRALVEWLGERVRIRSYDTWVCYSRFVQGYMRERLGVPEPVAIAPPVDLDRRPPGQKGPSVIAVGRFFASSDANNKKHAVLIDAFRRLHERDGAAGWTLHMVGGAHSDRGTAEYLEGLRARAEGLPVAFHPNAESATLLGLYREASLFWHAAGFGETLPERLEHFGITTVEAMTHGCVPVVHGVGGQAEIVEDGRTGLLWGSVDELVERSAALMADPASIAALGAAARAAARRYGKDRFLESVRDVVLGPASRR